MNFNESIVRKNIVKALKESNDDPKIINMADLSHTEYYLVSNVFLNDSVSDDCLAFLKKIDKDVVSCVDDSGNYFSAGFEFSFKEPYDPIKMKKRLDAISKALVKYCDDNGIGYRLIKNYTQFVAMDY